MMPWSTSTRRADLPKNWGTLRLQVKARAGGQCEATTDHGRCQREGSECHHTGERTDHRLEMLRWICKDCHRAETQREAAQAKANRHDRTRPIEKHPSVRD